MSTRQVQRTFIADVVATAEVGPSATALADADRAVSYGELLALVEARSGAWDLPPRSLVVLTGDRSVEFVVTYLALHRAGHVPLLAGSHVDDLASSWSPAAVVDATRDGSELHRLDHTSHDLHPDLALLMSTSGSTGAPKLVRLSHANLLSNAAAIADALGLTATDRAITTLPLHYCYGLSVLHSHLIAGASVVMSDASVVDPCFAAAIDRHGVTNVAGVPHTFELLERSGFDAADHPSIRFLTQAGGRMPPERVRRWASGLAGEGVALHVMYGQTEATARMATLRPELAATHPYAIGAPIAGGSFELRPHTGAGGPDEGEIVYRGPNVMMGYALEAADLARPHELEELATGDLARFHGDAGVYEVIGRASRFVKPFGLRIELDRVEQALVSRGWNAAVAGDDDGLVVGLVDGDPSTVRATVAEQTSLPVGCITVVACDDLPRTPSGKIDGAALMSLAADRTATSDERAGGSPAGPRAGSIAAILGDVLERPHVAPTDTFVGLGGDSLSYVECSLRLETVLGNLPADWHLRTIAELERLTPSRAIPRLDTTVAIRALAICAIVATHMRVIRIPGGAHTLLAIAGYNLARFQLSLPGARQRIVGCVRTAARVAVPTSLWIGINMLVAGGYSVGSLLLVNDYTGSPWRTGGRWQYWYFEVFVQLVLATALLLAVPVVRRAESRVPFAFAAALLVPLLAFRFRWWELGDDYNYLFRTHSVAWFFVLGWAIQRADRVWQRAAVTVLAVAVIPGFFDRPQRDVFVIVALVLLTWVRALPLARRLHRPIGMVAAASMWIFLVHWQVWPPLVSVFRREVAFVVTVAIGVAVGWLVSLAATPVTRWVRDPWSRSVNMTPAEPATRASLT